MSLAHTMEQNTLMGYVSVAPEQKLGCTSEGNLCYPSLFFFSAIGQEGTLLPPHRQRGTVQPFSERLRGWGVRLADTLCVRNLMLHGHLPRAPTRRQQGLGRTTCFRNLSRNDDSK